MLGALALLGLAALAQPRRRRSRLSGLGSLCDEKDARAREWRRLMYSYDSAPESEWPRIEAEQKRAKAAYEEAEDACHREFDAEVQAKRRAKGKR